MSTEASGHQQRAGVLLEQTGWSMSTAARRITRTAQENGRCLRYSAPSVNHWLTGVRPSPQAVPITVETFARALDRPDLTAEEPRPARRRGRLPGQPVGGRPDRLPVEHRARRHARPGPVPVRRAVQQRLPVPRVACALPPAVGTGAPDSPRHLGDVALLRAGTKSPRETYGAFGGGYARTVGSCFLVDDTLPLLYGGSGATRRGLLSAAAEVTCRLGAMYASRRRSGRPALLHPGPAVRRRSRRSRRARRRVRHAGGARGPHQATAYRVEPAGGRRSATTSRCATPRPRRTGHGARLLGRGGGGTCRSRRRRTRPGDDREPRAAPRVRRSPDQRVRAPGRVGCTRPSANWTAPLATWPSHRRPLGRVSASAGRRPGSAWPDARGSGRPDAAECIRMVTGDLVVVVSARLAAETTALCAPVGGRPTALCPPRSPTATRPVSST